MCDPPTPASLVAEAELFAAPPGRLARLILDLGSADTEAAAVVRDLADAPSERSTGGATVIALDPPLARVWRAHPAGRAGECARMSVNRTGWTVGADDMAPRDWSGEVVQMPSGRLHAVSATGLIAGRALCLAPVTLLDPRDWRWPDDGDEEWPLCWICLALTHVQS